MLHGLLLVSLRILQVVAHKIRGFKLYGFETLQAIEIPTLILHA